MFPVTASFSAPDKTAETILPETGENVLAATAETAETGLTETDRHGDDARR
jgi:hypothetical protein